MKQASFLLISLLALAGCSPLQTAPPPAPTLELPTAWRDHGEPEAGAMQAGIGPVAMPPAAAVAPETLVWRAFGDPVLADLVHRALARNGDVRVAISRLQEFQARIRVADSAREPSLTANLSPGRARAIGGLGVPVEA